MNEGRREAGGAPGAGGGDAQEAWERGLALHREGRLDEAEVVYRDLLRRQPGTAEVLHTLGVLQAQRGQLAEAEALMAQAIQADPCHITALVNRGNLLRALGRTGEALASYERALEFQPENPKVLLDLGLLLAGQNRMAEAVAAYDRALVIKPDFVDALNNRGIALAHLGRTVEALESYDRAVAGNPVYAEALNNRGALLANQGRYEAALENYDRALLIKPDFAGFLDNRAGLFRLMGLHERAAQDYSRLLESNPDDAQALGHRCYACAQICNWAHHKADQSRLVIHVQSGGPILPFTMLVLSDLAAEQLRCARTYSRRKYPLAKKPLWSGERYRHQRIRVAYLSADFHLHATAQLMAELFERHDKERFEVSAWSFGPETGDSMRARLRRAFEQFKDVRDMSDDGVAGMLRDHEIDIVVDLKGYSKSSRPAIFARRPAPIQINYLVYPGTTGADYMDYIIGDAEVIPVGHDEFYSEHVVRLPDSYQVNDSRREIGVKAPGRTEAGLPESGFVFCCFNNNYKITPEVFDVWMRLLKQVAGSVLWLLEDNDLASRNLRAEAEARGVGANRLVFAPRLLPPEHLARHRLADLFLDTLPCNAHTTASDALWTGLPLLTCRGNAFPGRVAASLLRAIGLPELITENLTEYEALALKLASMPNMLAGIRSRLAQNRSTAPLFDIERYRRHLESAYITMYERYQQGLPPQGFSVTKHECAKGAQ